MLRELFSCLLEADCSLLFAIDLVGNNPDADILSSIFLDVVEPHIHVVKGVKVGDIIHKENGMGIPEIPWYETSESFLSGCVPQLQAYGAVRDDHIFGEEVDADGGLYDISTTLWVGSNQFLMNLLMIELFPTAWSPMKTILNLMVCFLLVAQLISSSPLFIMRSYKLSETYSIIRISMDIYQVSKYENIADRLRRLASNPNLNPNGVEHAQGYAAKQNTSVTAHRKENQTFDTDRRAKYMDNLKYSKMSTIETEVKSDDQEDSYINERFIFKESQSNIPIKQIKTTYSRPPINRQPPRQQEAEEKSFPWRNDRFEGIEREEKKSLAKVKSDGNLKIEDILENFNSYKQNKERFLSSLNKSTAHNRTETDNVARYARESSKIDEPKEKPEEKSRIFNIDNIWNEESVEEDKAPKFERSRRTFRGLDELSDMLNDPTAFKETVVEPTPRDFSRPRQIMKNPSKPIEQPSERMTLRTMLSPRGTRVAGKICKNTKGPCFQ